jgi:Na+-transporting NADH:ubiquinone oxidoreductase subunit A
MNHFRLTKGLTLPIEGPPQQETAETGLQADIAGAVTEVALIGPDYVGMRPTMAVQVGDRVKKGQLLFEDKKTPGVKHTSPAAGTVQSINRGEKRAFLSVVIALDGDNDWEEDEVFATCGPHNLEKLSVEDVRSNLINSGLWTALRTRPFSRVPAIDSLPHSLFVTAIDTHPLAAWPEPIIRDRAEDFQNGLRVLSRIAGKQLYLCRAPQEEPLPGEELPFVETAVFDGPHPAGLPGTHIHKLDPVGGHKTAWHIGYQDVIAVGSLFTTGRLDTTRVISLGGPSVKNPRLIRTRIGANLTELLKDELQEGKSENDCHRIVSGSVLGGCQADDHLEYLGRFHNQITVLPEMTQREFFGWIMPGVNKFSLTRTLLSAFLPPRRLPLDTAQNGGERSIFPVDAFDRVTPIDIMPVFLFRALAIQDIEGSEELGCLELDEEDLALCTFACPGKNDYGVMLREMLTTIEKEG